MTTYTLTVSTDDLGLGVISGARVVVERKRTEVTDIFNGRSIGTNSTATNSLGVATILLEPDDGSVYHELKIFDLAGILVYSKIFTMPPQAVAVTALPVQDIISSSAAQAVAAAATSTAQAVISTAQAVIATAQAGTATTQAGISTTQAGISTAQAVIATAQAVLTAADVVTTVAARDSAQGYSALAAAARDAALLSRGVFATTAKALSDGVINYSSLVAGTGGTNGTFAISFSGGAGTGAAGYFTVAGGSITSITFTATGDSYTSAPTMSFAASSGLTGASATAVIGANVNSGEYFSVVASNSNEYLILYLNDSGTAVEQKRYPSAVPIDLLINGNFSSLGFQFKKLAVESGYAYALVDSTDRAAILVGLDGSVTFPKYAFQTTVEGLLTNVELLNSGDFGSLGFKFKALAMESGYAYALTDSGGKSVLMVGFDGTVTIPKYSKDVFIPQELLADTGYVWGVLDSLKRIALGIKTDGTLFFKNSNYLVPSRNLWCNGDSLTAGAGAQVTWREALPALLTVPRTITNNAIGGQTSTQIAARAGAYFDLLTVTGNTIPTSGAVSITARTVSLMTSQGAQSLTGKLNGIAGTLARDGSDNYTFTRASAGTATYTAPKSPFVPDVADHEFDTFIVFLGRNNLSLPNDIIRDIELCVNLQKTVEKRFLIITPPNGGTITPGVSTNEGTGTSTLTNIKAVEDWAVQKYGDRVLRSREFSFQFNNGSADDLDDVAKETVPRSLRIDTVHWTTALHAQVAAWVASQINSRGW